MVAKAVTLYSLDLLVMGGDEFVVFCDGGFGLMYNGLSNRGSCEDIFGKNGDIGNVGAGGIGGDGGLGGFYLGKNKRHASGNRGNDGRDGSWITIYP